MQPSMGKWMGTSCSAWIAPFSWQLTYKGVPATAGGHRSARCSVLSRTLARKESDDFEAEAELPSCHEMKMIQLGETGLQVSEMGYGCMGLTTAYGVKSLTDGEIVNLLKKVANSGVTFWDTANVYCYPDMKKLLKFQSPVACQEEIIGRAIQEIGRDEITIATKTGLRLSVFPKMRLTPDGDPSFIRHQCEMSLKRLGVDSIDLFYLHRIDPNIPIEISMATMRDLINEGKIKHIGLSECSAATLRRAHKVHPVTCIQMEWSLWCRGIEDAIIPTCIELGVGIVPYSPLGRGFFGGAVTSSSDFKKGFDHRSQEERFQGKALETNVAILNEVEQIAAEIGATSSQVALAWLKYKQRTLKIPGIVPIPGTTKEKNFLSNVSGFKLDLTDAMVEKLEFAASANAVAGQRNMPGLACWENDNNKRQE